VTKDRPLAIQLHHEPGLFTTLLCVV
jgi:hypothetical protein